MASVLHRPVIQIPECPSCAPDCHSVNFDDAQVSERIYKAQDDPVPDNFSEFSTHWYDISGNACLTNTGNWNKSCKQNETSHTNLEWPPTVSLSKPDLILREQTTVVLIRGLFVDSDPQSRVRGGRKLACCGQVPPFRHFSGRKQRPGLNSELLIIHVLVTLNSRNLSPSPVTGPTKALSHSICNFSDADDKPRHHGGQRYVDKCNQEEYWCAECSIYSHKLGDIIEQSPNQGSEWLVSCGGLWKDGERERQQ